MIHAATAQGRARSREARPDLSSAQRGQPPRPTWPALSRNSPEGRGGLCETWSVPLAPWARGHGGTPALTQPCPSRRAPFPPPRAPPRLVMPAPSALTRWRLTADCEGSSRAEPRKSHFYRLSLRPPFLGASRPPRPRFRPRRALPAGHAGRLSPAEAWALARPNCDPEYLLLQARGCSTSGPRNPSPSLGLREVLQSQRSCSRLLAPKRDTLYIRLGDWVWGGRKPPSLRPSPRPPRPPRPGRRARSRRLLLPGAGGGRGAGEGPTGRRATSWWAERQCAQARPAASIHSAPSRSARYYSRVGFFSLIFFFLNRWVRGEREQERRPSLVWKRRGAPTS